MAQKYVNLSDTEAGKYISHSLEKVVLMPRRSQNAPAITITEFFYRVLIKLQNTSAKVETNGF